MDKTKICNDLGITLIHIFEDEWLQKRDIVESKLKHLLKIQGNRIVAKKCKVQEITSKSKNNFLNEHHLQGQDISEVNLGLFHEEDLVSVMTFSKPRITMGKKVTEKKEYELSRFACIKNYNIVGGAGKLLEYFKRNYIWEEIYTYADLRWSKGNLYKTLKMEFDHMVKPNYWYFKIDDKERFYRYGFRKQRLKILFPESDITKPEAMIMLENGYDRIWDCGCLKYKLTNHN